MTILSALIPRIRRRHSKVVSIRCASCRTWRKPRDFARTGNTCHSCSYSSAYRRIAARAARQA